MQYTAANYRIHPQDTIGIEAHQICNNQDEFLDRFIQYSLRLYLIIVYSRCYTGVIEYADSEYGVINM